MSDTYSIELPSDPPLAGRTGPVFHAGNAFPSRTRYHVTESHKHDALTEGNVVVVVEDPQLNNWLLRVSDMTLHPLTGEHGQYVHLANIESPNAPASATGQENNP